MSNMELKMRTKEISLTLITLTENEITMTSWEYLEMQVMKISEKLIENLL